MLGSLHLKGRGRRGLQPPPRRDAGGHAVVPSQRGVPAGKQPGLCPRAGISSPRQTIPRDTGTLCPNTPENPGPHRSHPGVVWAGTQPPAKTCCCRANLADDRFARTVPQPWAMHPAALHSLAASPRDSPKEKIPSLVTPESAHSQESRVGPGESPQNGWPCPGTDPMGAIARRAMVRGGTGPGTTGPQLATPGTAHTARHGPAWPFLTT